MNFFGIDPYSSIVEDKSSFVGKTIERPTNQLTGQPTNQEREGEREEEKEEGTTERGRGLIGYEMM